MKNSKSLRVVIVGCGGFSRNYLPIYRSIPDLQVVACVDADLAAAKAMAVQLGADLHSDDFAVAVDTPADFAVLSTPNFLHVEQAKALIGSGKHLLLQKPMARFLPEARQLFDYHREASDRTMGLFMSMLDYGLWWELRDRLRQEKSLGAITQVSMRLGHTGGLLWNQQGTNLWRFSREKTGGGAFIMLGVHYIHFVRWLLGLRILRVIAQAANLHCPKVEGEDICQFQGELENGGLVQLSVAWNSQGEHFAAYGTEGTFLYLDNEHLRVHGARPWKTSYFDYTKAGTWQNFSGLVPPKLDDPANPHNQHRRFAEAIRGGCQPDVPAIEGLWDMQVTDAVYRSVKTGQWEAVSYV
jgi:UDP-N-acetyl-2-amino-2-deoxyglucuronate dehydrogenase